MTHLQLFHEHYHLIERVVNSIARKGKYRSIELDDMKQIAAISLLLSAQKWKPGIVPFGPYAVQHIYFALNDEHRKNKRTFEELNDEMVGIKYGENFYNAKWSYSFIRNCKNLTEREREIIDFICSDFTDREIAEQVKLSAERVRQIKLHGIAKIQKAWKNVRRFGL